MPFSQELDFSLDTFREAVKMSFQMNELKESIIMYPANCTEQIKIGCLGQMYAYAKKEWRNSPLLLVWMKPNENFENSLLFSQNATVSHHLIWIYPSMYWQLDLKPSE